MTERQELDDLLDEALSKIPLRTGGPSRRISESPSAFYPEREVVRYYALWVRYHCRGCGNDSMPQFEGIYEESKALRERPGHFRVGALLSRRVGSVELMEAEIRRGSATISADRDYCEKCTGAIEWKSE